MFFIITHNSIPGYHAWVGAPEKLKFLSFEHRHIFEIRCKIPVKHSDREKEIIETQDEIQRYLLGKYSVDNDPTSMHLGGMSCEMLAQEIAAEFNCSEVEVLEDGYGGAMYVR